MLRILGLCLLIVVLAACSNDDDQLLLGATTSIQDPGLLDVLVEEFEEQYDYDVKPIVQGSGQILTLARAGEFDVIITHSPADEQELIDERYATGKTEVMQNFFEVVGPADDPARVADSMSMPDTMARIAEAGAHFISRGDESGTHKRELSYWEEAGLDSAGQPWYSESAAGQGQTLTFANDRAAYTLVDSSTFASYEDRIELQILYRDEDAPNVYSVLHLDDRRLSHVDTDARDAWIEFLTSPAGQRVIAEFGVEQYGEPLFEPLVIP